MDESGYYVGELVGSVVGIVLSVVSIIIAIVAIRQTNKEIRNHNKQTLFEKRIDNYIVCRKLYETLKENIDLLKYKTEDKESPIDVTYPTIMIMNCTFLEEAAKVMGDVNNYELRKIFLKTLENIEEEAEKCRLLFDETIAMSAFEFLMSYKDFLMQCYKYQILDIYMLEHNKKIPSSRPMDYVELQKYYKEPAERKKLIVSEKKLKKAYRKMSSEQIIAKIQAATRLE